MVPGMYYMNIKRSTVRMLWMMGFHMKRCDSPSIHVYINIGSDARPSPPSTEPRCRCLYTTSLLFLLYARMH